MQKSSLSEFFTPIPIEDRLIFTDKREILLPYGEPRGLHYHSLWEVGICRGGSGLWFTEGRAYAISIGDAVIVHPSCRHYSRSVGHEGCRCEFIYFDAEQLLSECGISSERLPLYPTEAAVFTNSDERSRTMLSEMVTAVKSSKVESAHWFSLFLLSLPSENEPVKSRSHRGDTAPAMNRMLVAFTEELTLESLAAECAMSPSWFLKRFKAEHGVTPMRRLAELRVGIAAQLLAGSTLSITEISGYVGFSTPSELYRHFHAHYSLSPSEYRKLSHR